MGIGQGPIRGWAAEGEVTVERVEQSTGRITTRRSRVRKRPFAHNRGFATVNDGPAFAS